eukprot:396293-Rhodomonas_salina.2
MRYCSAYVLRIRYALSGTSICPFGTHISRIRAAMASTPVPTCLLSYALTTPCPVLASAALVLTSAMLLPGRSGHGFVPPGITAYYKYAVGPYLPTREPSAGSEGGGFCYAASGTGIAYAAMSSFRNVRYRHSV